MPESLTLSLDGSWAAGQLGPGILGSSSGRGDAMGIGRGFESPGLKVRQW